MSDENNKCQVCGKPSTQRCPECRKQGLPDAHYCSQDCFKEAWKTHKSVHAAANATPGGHSDPTTTTQLQQQQQQQQQVMPPPELFEKLIEQDPGKLIEILEPKIEECKERSPDQVTLLQYSARAHHEAAERQHIAGDYQKAHDLWQKELEILRRLFPGSDHPNIATALDNIGLACGGLQKYDKAIEYQKQSLDMLRRQQKAQDDAEIANALNNLGWSHQQLGQFKEALVYAQEARDIRRRLHSQEDHADLAMSLGNVGRLMESLGNVAEGLKFQHESLNMMRRIYKDQDHRDLAKSLAYVGWKLFDALDQHQEGLEMQIEGVAMMRRTCGNFISPDLAVAINNLGVSIELTGDEEKGLVLQKEALQMRRLLFGQQRGGDHPEIAESLHNVGSLLVRMAAAAGGSATNSGDAGKASITEETRQQRMREGLALMKEGLAMERRLHENQDHEFIALALGTIGETLVKLGEKEEATTCLQECADMRKRLGAAMGH